MTTPRILLSFPLLLLLVHHPLPTRTGSDWTTECLNRYAQSCRCTWSSGKRLADCQKSSMNSLPLLSNDIQILDMTNNKLIQLGDNAFTKANLINLQKLYLKGCWIKTIHELAFNDLRILIEVDLSHNELETLDPSVFVTNERLRVIKLNNNKLITIGEFPVLEHVNTVDLSYNSLTNFSFHTFTGARNLKVLDISYNQFQNLNPEIFPRLSSLGLRGNAWVCDCELKPLRDYVIVNKFYETDIRCLEPLSLFNLQWDGFGELSCKPEIMHILANGKVVDSIVAMENTLVLSCVVKGDPTPDVKWVKNGRVVNEAVGGIAGDSEGTVILNLTVSKHDNEFVCVGSNSGGVVERNLTVTVDEAGLSGFVVFKDGGMHDRERTGPGNLVIYLVIGVVFLSLVVGLVVGGVCVWRWGARRDRDGVVKGTSVVKGVNTGGDVVGGDVGKEREGGGRAEEPAFEQVPLLKTPTIEDGEDDDEMIMTMPSRPTPDLLISGPAAAQDPVYEDEPYDEENAYVSSNKFPCDEEESASIYDNYALTYKPVGSDALRRYAFLRNNHGSPGPASLYGTLGSPNQRPASVCSESRGVVTTRGSGGGSDTVIIPHGYVTLPRRHPAKKKPTGREGVIKYDNLGVRTTADGSSMQSLINCGVDPSNNPLQSPPQSQETPHYSNVPEMMMMEQEGLPAYSYYPEPKFDPIIETENEVDNNTAPAGNDDAAQVGASSERPKKFRPVPPPKPKKKKQRLDEEENGKVVIDDDITRVDELASSSGPFVESDDGTEV